MAPSPSCSRIRYVISNISVEPIFILYSLSFSLYYVIFQNLMIEKACKVNLNQTNQICDNLKDPLNSEIQIEVQKLVTNVKMWTTLSSSIPSAFFVIFVGPLSDKIGRRLPMILPFIGHVIIAFLLCLLVFFSQLPVEACVIESIWGIFGGGFATVSLLSYSYLADVTSQVNRTSRISILDGLKMLGDPIGTFLSGLLYKHYGYYFVFSLSGSCALLGALYVVYILEESVVREKKEGAEKTETFCQVMRKNHPGTVLNTIFKPREGLKRMMILWCFCVLMAHQLQDKSALYLYTRRNFGWTEQDYTLYKTVDSLHGMARAFIVMPVLSKLLQVHDPLIGMMGALSWACYYAVTGLATSGWMMYMATGLSSFGGLTSTPIITLLSKLVPSTEMGAVLSLSSGLVVLEDLLDSVLFSQVYEATVANWPGFIFILISGLTIGVALMFLILLAMLLKHEAKYGNLLQHSKKSRVCDI